VRIRCGVRPAAMGNCSNSALISAKRAWPSTSRASASHLRKAGRPSLRITSRPWCRSTHRADNSFPGSVRVPSAGSRSKADRPFQCDRPSDGGVDGATTAGGVSLRPGAAISAPRQGQDVWSRVQPAGGRSGNGGGARRAAIAMAARLRGTRHRDDSAASASIT
jgi:hypothetical protein